LEVRRAEVLVDLTDLAELRGIAQRPDGDLDIGAGEPMWHLERAAVVKSHAPLLVRVLGSVGAVGVRSRATLGGSLGWADPTSQLPATLIALDARVETTSRTVAVEDLLVARHRTALERGELIVRVIVPATPDPGAFQLVRRSHLTWPALGAVAARHGDATRLVVFGAAPTPIRLRAQDEPGVIAELDQRVDPWRDERVSATYRRQVAPVVARRALGELAVSA
jgi:carbon-monoxide dehydrogenase medium subunit